MTPSQHQPAPLPFDIKGFVGRARSEFRKFSAFASATIAIADLLTQIVQHSAKLQRSTVMPYTMLTNDRGVIWRAAIRKSRSVVWTMQLRRHGDQWKLDEEMPEARSIRRRRATDKVG